VSKVLNANMIFTDTHVNKEKRYSLGIEKNSGEFYISFPVYNGLVEYEEYYQLTTEQYDGYPENSVELEQFLNECKSQKKMSYYYKKLARFVAMPLNNQSTILSVRI